MLCNVQDSLIQSNCLLKANSTHGENHQTVSFHVRLVEIHKQSKAKQSKKKKKKKIEHTKTTKLQIAPL